MKSTHDRMAKGYTARVLYQVIPADQKLKRLPRTRQNDALNYVAK